MLQSKRTEIISKRTNQQVRSQTCLELDLDQQVLNGSRSTLDEIVHVVIGQIEMQSPQHFACNHNM